MITYEAFGAQGYHTLPTTAEIGVKTLRVLLAPRAFHFNHKIK
jgi:hypothetical protein